MKVPDSYKKCKYSELNAQVKNVIKAPIKSLNFAEVSNGMLEWPSLQNIVIGKSFCFQAPLVCFHAVSVL